MQKQIQVIEQMLTGEMPMPEFIRRLRTDSELQDTIRHLVPPEAVNNRGHAFWARISYRALEEDGFDFLRHLYGICHFDGGIGDNLDLFGSIRAAYRFYKPNLNYTSQYTDEYNTYLDAVGEYYEGPEVTELLNQIVTEALPIKPKRKREKMLREKLKETFHVVGKKRPYWIQGADWPMGKNSPMQYIGSEKIEDGVQYVFRDVDTGETRIVEQFY